MAKVGAVCKIRALTVLLTMGFLWHALGYSAPQGDRLPLHDPLRPVTDIGWDYVVLQYHTRTPTETRVQIRQSDLPMTAWRPEGKRVDPWQGAGVRIVEGEPGKRTYHRLLIYSLEPGKRYYYRIYDPDHKPTLEERKWGASPPWRREYAFATLAPPGYKTIIRLPVKVLLMPNVVNVASAYQDPDNPAPPPPPMSEAELARIREEYAIAARYFWVNSRMRLWVDFRIFVDDRWQRWGDEPPQAQGFYKGLPVCRSYAGVDFAFPGGGAFTIVDTDDIQRTNTEPVYEELPYAGQIEQAFPRRWNPQTKRWEFYNSGGGTYGVDGFPDGFPARSQFLGGGDTAWLVAHEFHHQMESFGAFSLANREDERIVFNHPEPRYRRVNADGSVAMNAWNTAGKHGEHWNVMAYWDRTLSDAQWLRLYFGEVVVVRDADGDGFPDDDPRLPLDEKRFGSDPRRMSTNGSIMDDLAIVMLSTWAPAPLQNTFVKPRWQSRVPDPREVDQDGDRLPDTLDPYPLYPWQPFVWYARATVDGDPSEWDAIPPAGELSIDGTRLTVKHCHDEDAYYVLFEITGEWERLHASLDGEGKGVYATDSVLFVDIRNGEEVSLRVHRDAPYLRWKTSRPRHRTTVVELAIPNGGDSPWFWQGGGREVGISVDLYQPSGTGYSVYEPYDVFYCRMMEPMGTLPLPAGAPAELTREQATRALTPDRAEGLQIGAGWQVRDGAWAYDGHAEAHLRITGLRAREFDLWVELEATQDGVLAAYLPATREAEMNAGRDYVLFVGGYANTRTRFRLFGAETSHSEQMMTPGRHTLQFTRRGGKLWALFDGKPILYARDPNPNQPIGTLAVIGGYGGRQRIYEIRYRVSPEAGQ